MIPFMARERLELGPHGQGSQESRREVALPSYITPCAEFPNDNPALHRGATWVCEFLLGAPVAVSMESERTSESVADLGLADDSGEAIEVVDDLDAVVAETSTPEDDAFSRFVRMLEDIASVSGTPDSALRLSQALASDPTAAAWRAILLAESNDFAACGPQTLDEWAADLVAQALAAPAKTEIVRRELRSRGVAAFGLVAA
jgi:hypothetical protein